MAGRLLSVTVGTIPDLPLSGVVADAADVTDAVMTATAGVRPVAEAVGVADAAGAMLDAQRTGSESIGVADAVSALFSGAGPEQVGWVGDSLTHQDGTGQANIKAGLVAAGWSSADADTKVNGLIGRSIINGVAPYIPSSQDVITTWRAGGFNPRTWVFALITNDEWDTDNGWTTKVNTLLAKVKEVPHASGLPYRVFWVGGPLYRQDVADANSPTYANRASRFAAVMASIRTTQLAGGQIGEMTYIDFPALYRDGRDETGHWQAGDSTGRHMTATGYSVRNALTVPLVTLPGSPPAGLFPAGALYPSTSLYPNG